MTTPESIGSLEKDREALLRTRKLLGRPIFEDQESGERQAFQFVSRGINNFLKNGRQVIEENMRTRINSSRKEQIKITPAYIALQGCFSMSEGIRHIVLIELAGGGQKENRPIDIAALDVIKGFHQVLLEMDSIYRIPTNENEDKKTLLINDPKGFTVAEERAKFWSDPLQEKSGFIESYENTELIAAGAKLAAKTYKRMYPIAEKVLSGR